jgi:putative cell wall-binding protein
MVLLVIGAFVTPASAGSVKVTVTTVTENSLMEVAGKDYQAGQIALCDPAYSGMVASLGLLPIDDEGLEALAGSTGIGFLDLSKKSYENLTSRLLGEFSRPEKLVVARRDIPADSYAAAAYARAVGAPLVLVYPNIVPNSVQETIKLLSPGSTLLVGGEKAISENVSFRLQAGKRIWGQNRVETAVRIAEELVELKGINEIDVAVVTDGRKPDPTAVFLSVEFGAPLLYVEGDHVPDSTATFLSSHRYMVSLPVYDDDGILLEPGRNGGIRDYYLVGVSEEAEARLRDLLE